MEKNKDIKLLLMIIMATVVFIFVIMLIIPKFEKDKTNVYRLKSSEGIIGLYFGEEIVEEYDNVVLDNLPLGDRVSLERGIEFYSIEDAKRALEDFDG